MKNLVICFMLLTTLLLGDKMGNFENITDSFDVAQKMNITIENMTAQLNKGDDKFEQIIVVLKNVTKHAHDMPAFGVSLDDLTINEMKEGIWLELVFNEPYVFNEMPFEALLIKVEKDIYGFNLIRKNNGKYDGRCFYLSLNESMNDLYEKINSLNLNFQNKKTAR